jgi:hypothetical protein
MPNQKAEETEEGLVEMERCSGYEVEALGQRNLKSIDRNGQICPNLLRTAMGQEGPFCQ